jgi:hypothetical protein
MPKRKATKHIKREPIQEDEEMVKLEREPDVGASDLVWDSKPDLDSDYEAKPKRRKTKGGKSGKATSQAANRASRAGTNGKKWTGAQLEALFAAATHETTLARFKDAVDGRTPAQCYSTWRWV